MGKQKRGEALEALMKQFETAANHCETEMDKVFPNKERELYSRIIIERFKEATDDQQIYSIIVRVYTISTGGLLGFLPSEYYASCERAWSIFDTINVPTDAPSIFEAVLANSRPEITHQTCKDLLTDRSQ